MRRQQLHVKRNPIDPDVSQYYLELLLRLTYENQEYIIDSIIADELCKEGWSDDEVSEYYDQIVKDQRKSISTGDINVDISPLRHKQLLHSSQVPIKDEGAGGLSYEAQNDIMNNRAWELSLVGLSPRAINQQYDALIEDNYQLLTEETASSEVIWAPQPNKQWARMSTRIVEEQRDTPVDNPIVNSIRRKYLLKMKVLEALSREEHNAILKGMAYQLYEVGLSPSEVNNHLMIASKTTINGQRKRQ